MKNTLFILTGFIILLLAADFTAERRPTPHPVIQRHAPHGTVEAIPVWYSFMGWDTLYVCRDSAATLFGHRALNDKQREAYEEQQKSDMEEL